MYFIIKIYTYNEYYYDIRDIMLSAENNFKFTPFVNIFLLDTLLNIQKLMHFYLLIIYYGNLKKVFYVIK